MYRIFIIEDDDIIAGIIADTLKNWSFESKICEDFRNVTAEFTTYDPHLVLMYSLPFSTAITGAAR